MASLHDIVQPSEEAPAAESADTNSRPPYKSFRKKFRKMKLRFDEVMSQSNTMYKDEHKAVALARRLQEQNDQLLDMLLDLNESAHIPAHSRYDLRCPSPTSSVQCLDDDLFLPDFIHKSLRQAKSDFATGAITSEEFSQREAALIAKQNTTSPISLALLTAHVPHTKTPPPNLPEDLVGAFPVGYMHSAQEEEYLASLDASLKDAAVYDPDDKTGRPLHLPDRGLPSDKELAIRNPNSVYNWLRRNQPHVFLQDKEKDEVTSEKSGPRGAGHTRGGGGKRGGRESGVGTRSEAAVHATPSKSDVDMMDEDFVPETSASARSRRVNKDDEPYRPKGGYSSRSIKRKREDGESVRGGRKKMARLSGGA